MCQIWGTFHDVYLGMARRYKKSPAEEIFEALIKMSSVFPWWISIGVAGLLFFFVPFNLSEPQDSFSPNDVSGMLIGIIFGIMFKYFVPAALAIGGILNLFNRGKSAWIFSALSTKGAKETLRDLNWKDFEFLVSEYFKKEDYQVNLIDAQGADGGVDIKLYKNGELYLVQCKHYKAWKVSVKVVRELYGVMAAENAAGGFIVTTGKFTKDACSFAKDNGVELIDGNKLEKILDEDSQNSIPVGVTHAQANTCPVCGSELVRRSGPRGEFWGCASFPKCRFTKS